MNSAKLVVLGLWALCFGSFFLAPDSVASRIGRVVFWLMVAAHLVECAVFLPALRRAPGALPAHLLKTFALGFAHLREVQAAEAKGQSEG